MWFKVGTTQIQMDHIKTIRERDGLVIVDIGEGCLELSKADAAPLLARIELIEKLEEAGFRNMEAQLKQSQQPQIQRGPIILPNLKMPKGGRG